MGWFSNVTDFLSSPGFRIGAGIAGLASGAGAFGDMGGWGTALQGLSGAANLAAGAASTFGPNRSTLDRATGALQLGLGGYNAAQSAGAVGSFGDVWNQISGGGARGSGAIPGLTDDSGAISGYPGYDDSVQRRALAPFPGEPNTMQNPHWSFNEDPAQYNIIRPDGSIGAPPTLTPALRGAGGETFSSTVSALTNPNGPMDDSFGGALPNQSYAQVPGGPAPVLNPDGTFSNPDTGAPVTVPGQSAPAAAAPAPTPAPPGSLDVTPQPTPPHPVPSTTVAPTTPAVTPPAATPPATTGFRPGMSTSAIKPVSVQLTGDWFDRTLDNLLTTAEKSPIAAATAALQVGSMLAGLFAQSRSDIANDALARMDPNSPDGAEFRRLYEERARQEIENQAATVRSGLEAKFASRGMLRSTVYTNAVQSLEDSRIKLLADLPLTSLNAWNATPIGSGRGLTSAAQFATATSTPMDFSSMTRVLGQSPFAQQLSANAGRAA